MRGSRNLLRGAEGGGAIIWGANRATEAGGRMTACTSDPEHDIDSNQKGVRCQPDMNVKSNK